MSKLGVVSEKLIEIGWLAAVVTIPVLFNVYTADRFELHKVVLVRFLALLMALAWLLMTVERWAVSDGIGTKVGLRRRVGRLISRPLVLPALVVMGTTGLSTLWSIWPHGSLWGTYDRRQGSLTLLSYVVIALLTLAQVRRRAQVERLARFTAVGSVPVCLYALGQHFGLAPAPFTGRFGSRVASSFGNPIFLAAYLVMVVPLTLRQVIRSSRHALADRQSRACDLMLAVTYGGLLVVQVVVAVLTQSRGPFVALCVGVVLFLVLWALLEENMAAGLVVVGLALLAGSFLLTINLSDGLSAAMQDLPYVGRLSTISGASSLEQRTVIWEGAVALSSETPFRLMLGYGPEAMDLAFYGHYPAQLLEFEGPGRTADRSHNAILDVLVSTGLVGTIAYLFLVVSVFYYGTRALGLVSGRRHRAAFAMLLVSGGVAGASGSWLVGGLQLAAAGAAGGLVAGLIAYVGLFLVGVFHRADDGGAEPLLVAACLSAVIAHFVEIQMGIPVTATSLLFWVLSAVLGVAVLARDGKGSSQALGVSASATPTSEYSCDPVTDEAGPSEGSDGTPPIDPDVVQVLPSALMVGLLLISTAFAFVTHRSSLTEEPFTIVVLLLAWLWAGLITVGEASADSRRGKRGVGWLDLVFVYAVPTLLSVFGFTLCYVLVLNRFPGITAVPYLYYVILLSVLLAAAITLGGAASLTSPCFYARGWWLQSMAVLVFFVSAVPGGVNLVRADICFQLGQMHAESSRWDRSVALYEQATALAPRQDRYHQFLGHAYLKRAQPNTSERPAWFRKAEGALGRAVELSPLNPDHRGNLGNLYHAWADVTGDPEETIERLEQALIHYQEAVDLAPQTHSRLLEDAIFEAHVSLATSYSQLGRQEDALEEAMRARDVAPPRRKQEAEDLIERLRGPEE